MERTCKKRLKELKKNANRVVVRLEGDTAGLDLISGTIIKVREDHIVLVQANAGNSNHMIPISQVKTINY